MWRAGQGLTYMDWLILVNYSSFIGRLGLCDYKDRENMYYLPVNYIANPIAINIGKHET